MEKEIDIIRLKFPDCIRLRPGKEIGSTDNADVILREVIDNSVDELYQSKSCNKINITTIGNWYIVEDNGRGIPIKLDPELGITQTEVATSHMDAGSKFNKQDTAGIGMNGHGIKCTNALSNRFIILSKITDQNYNKSIPVVESTYNQLAGTDELFYYLEYEKGIKKFESAITKKDVERNFGWELNPGMSTIVAFQPDETIFESPTCSVDKKKLSYVNLIMEKFYNKTVEIYLNGKLITDSIKPYQFEFLTEVTSSKTNETAKFYVTFECDKNLNIYDVTGSVNSLIVNRGKHVDYVTNQYGEALKDVFSIDHGYLMQGLRILVVVLAGEVDFGSQTKEKLTKLCNISWADLDPLYKEFRKVFKSNIDYFQSHVDRLNEFAQALMNISTIDRIKQLISSESKGGGRNRSRVPDCVADASEQYDRRKCELFICEGRSAGGTLLRARDEKYQAVFHLRGVPMNAINADLDTLMDNAEMKAIIQAIDCGLNEYHTTEDPRYGKIIIAADADVDGLRIASLVVGMIAKKMTFLVKEKMVYVLETPLYKQNGNYIFPSDNIEELLDRNKPYTRFKGLGEVSVDDAKIVMANPETRRLRLVTLEGAQEALEILTSTSARKELMINSGTLTDPYNLGIYL